MYVPIRNCELYLPTCSNHSDPSLPVNLTSGFVEKALCCVYAFHLSCENVKITNEVQSWSLYRWVYAGAETSLCLGICSKLHYVIEASLLKIYMINSVISNQSSAYVLLLTYITVWSIKRASPCSWTAQCFNEDRAIL